jgi:hypothetical protein
MFSRYATLRDSSPIASHDERRLSEETVSIMLSDKFVFCAIILNIVGSSDYAVKTVRGLVRPNRVTWLFWAFIPLIAFSGQVSSGVGLQSLQTLSSGLLPLVIFCMSFFNRNSFWRLGFLDYVCAIASLLAILVWVATSDSSWAILFSILADFLAAMPTIAKAFFMPESENPITYLCATLSASIILLIIPQWDVPHAAFPIYLFATSALLFILSRRRRDNAGAARSSG